MYYIYILQSLKDHRYYIGQTNNLEDRLLRHNSSQVTATKNRTPLKIVYSEPCETRSESINREKKIKTMKGGIQFKKLISA